MSMEVEGIEEEEDAQDVEEAKAEEGHTPEGVTTLMAALLTPMESSESVQFQQQRALMVPWLWQVAVHGMSDMAATQRQLMGVEPPRRVDQVRLEVDDAAALTETVQSSILQDGNKESLIRAISNTLCKDYSKGNQPRQKMLLGFLNYLTPEDRKELEDQQQHPFARAPCAVKRCMKIGLLYPCEKSYGHMVATLVEVFHMAETSDDANNLLKEYKRLIKSFRPDHQASVPEFPADPRSLPAGVLEQAYDGQGASALLPCVMANHRPGKWMRGTSKELSMGSRSASSKKPNDLMGMMQNFQKMHQYMMMQMQGPGDDQEQSLSNLVVFPKKRKALCAPGPAGASAQQESPGGPTNASPGGPTNASPSGPTNAESQRQGSVLALQDQQVRKDVQTPDIPAPFQVPTAQSLLAAAAAAEQEVEEHTKEMSKAFQKRAALKKPACAAKAKATPKATSKSAAKAKPKAKSVAKATFKEASKRPSMIPKGGPTCFYLTGKIHRSDTGSCWRVFRHRSDRCDLKVNWKGSPATAWDRACSVIEEAAGKAAAK
eukprot:s4057_g8.t1